MYQFRCTFKRYLFFFHICRVVMASFLLGIWWILTLNSCVVVHACMCFRVHPFCTLVPSLMLPYRLGILEVSTYDFDPSLLICWFPFSLHMEALFMNKKCLVEICRFLQYYGTDLVLLWPLRKKKKDLVLLWCFDPGQSQWPIGQWMRPNWVPVAGTIGSLIL